MSRRKTALENVSKLASIGIQAIEAQKARRAWIDAKKSNRKLLLEYVDGLESSYQSGDDPEVDAAYALRKQAAKACRSEAAKLRYMIARYTEAQ